MIRISDLGFLSDLGLRISDFIHFVPALTAAFKAIFIKGFWFVIGRWTDMILRRSDALKQSF